jgi:hypothetical protein
MVGQPLMLNKNEKYIIKNYSKHGLTWCCDKLGILYKDGRNMLRRIKRKIKSSLYVNQNTIKIIYKNNNKNRDYNATNKVNADFFISPQKEQAYILGLLWADGYLNNKSQSNRICIECLERDLIPLKKLFTSWSCFTRKRKNRQAQLSYICNNIKLYNFLEQMDYADKTFKEPKKILDYLEKIDSNLIKYWFRGYFDGDGCVYHNKKHYLRQISFASGYKQNWNIFLKYLKNLNITNIKITKRILEKSNSKSSDLKFCGVENCNKFFKFIYPGNFDFGFRRKYDKFIEIQNNVN